MKHTNYICITGLRRSFYAFLLMLISLSGFSTSSYALHLSVTEKDIVFGDHSGAIYYLTQDWNMPSCLFSHNLKASAIRKCGGLEFTDERTIVDWHWGETFKMFSGDDGIIYVIDSTGRLYWFRHNNDFTHKLTFNQGVNGKIGSLIGSGWQQYSHVFSGGDGIIYAITKTGKMLWFRHTGRLDGSNKWASGSGRQVSRGWQGTKKVFSGDNGVIYSIMETGRLRWHKHLGRLTGTDNWVNKGIHQVVGFNWQRFPQVFSTNDGIIYAVTTSGDLLWHRHSGWLTGKAEWVLGSGKMIAKEYVNTLPLE